MLPLGRPFVPFVLRHATPPRPDLSEGPNFSQVDADDADSFLPWEHHHGMWFALIPSQVTSQAQGTWPSSLHEAFNVTVKTGGKGALATREGG